MSPIIDLHSHSYYSDGSLSPTELVTRAHAQGVKLLALTDHDETKGLAEAQEQAKKLGIHLVNGVEVSVSWQSKTIHIIGLGVDIDNPELQAGLKQIRDERVKRAKKIAEKMQKCGLENVWQEITEEVGFEAITRTHFARYLLARGHAKDMQQVFKRWLAPKGKAYVNGQWVALEQALAWIKQAGGQAVIAHPIRYRLTHAKLEELVKDFKQHGGVGIEVVGSYSNVKERSYVASLARRFGLLASVGSDFHSPGNPYIELGRNLTLPLETNAIWQDWPAYQDALQAVAS